MPSFTKEELLQSLQTFVEGKGAILLLAAESGSRGWGFASPDSDYDMEKIVRKLMKRDGMSHEEAQEYFNFNIGGAYMGEGTPMFLIAKINKSNPLDEIADNFT